MGKAFQYKRGVSVEDRFWVKVDKRGLQECWNWLASLDSRGYGNFGIKRGGKFVMQRAHRIAYELATGPVPAGLVVRHSCDNRRCCNPAHLSIGTQSDNMNDAVERGRLKRAGARNGRAKLRDADVVEIRLSADSLRVLAERYGVAKSTSASARARQTWI